MEIFRWELYSLLITLLASCCLTSSFLLEELKSMNYEVEILAVPMKEKDNSNLAVHIVSQAGQEFQCILPQLNDEDISEKDIIIEKEYDVLSLLKPIKNGPCLTKGKDWWTYEFCFGHYIKQYHIEDGHIVGQVITLGLYDSDFDWNNKSSQEKFKHTKQKYHSQYYVNGSNCDITGMPRTAEVRMYCEEDAGDYIYRVDEPGTCSYILTVYTSRLCSHPQLKPLPSKKAHVIACNPLLTERQFSSYLQKQKKEKAIADKDRDQWLNNQQERLKVMKNENGPLDKTQEDSFLFENDLKKMDETSNKISEDPGEEITLGRLKESSQSFTRVIKRLDGLFDKLEKIKGKGLHSLKKSNERVSMTFDTPDSDNKVKKKNSESSSENYESEKKKTTLSDSVDADNLHVQIRRLEPKSSDSSRKQNELDFEQRKKLEQAVKEKLEMAGLDTGGRRIEVKIITAGHYDNEKGKEFSSLTDKETDQFQSMIVALLTGEQDAVEEIKRQYKLEENYQFTWNDEETDEEI